ncbi:unnamed protein product [Moneuplotes crassus]|uniref:AP2/ERF domain-containing protein n=1 Tax=Euplotes crassus TaxID=5936 RepID=A0AAD1Y351_EUPCR|nr:unnamed protein product [Moneuplotes crassus]
MNSHNFSTFSQANNLPTWDSDRLVLEISQAFCMCPSVEMMPLSLNQFCDSRYIKSGTYPDIQKLFCNMSSSAQQQLPSSSLNQKVAKIKDSQPHLDGQKFSSKTDESGTIDEEHQAIKKRRRRSSRLEIRSRLMRVRSQILKQGISAFYSSPKKSRGIICEKSRRSKYIGVSKNNDHWQALINIGRTKKYIDIFLSEQEAARTYDVYAIAIKGLDANLNFNYTGAQMVAMIDHFLQHGQVVAPCAAETELSYLIR